MFKYHYEVKLVMKQSSNNLYDNNNENKFVLLHMLYKLYFRKLFICIYLKFWLIVCSHYALQCIMLSFYLIFCSKTSSWNLDKIICILLFFRLFYNNEVILTPHFLKYTFFLFMWPYKYILMLSFYVKVFL